MNEEPRGQKKLIPYTVKPANPNCPVVHATDPAHARHLIMFELGMKKWPPGVTCVPVGHEEPKPKKDDDEPKPSKS